MIHRRDNHRVVTVLSDVSGRLASDVMKDAWPRTKSLKIPSGYKLLSEGEEKERTKAFNQLIVIFIIIVLAIMFMLTIQFKSIKKSLVIMSSVPLAIIGAVIGLYISGSSIGFMEFLGIVSLAGMVIKNAVVWVEFVDQSLKAGHRFSDSIVQAGIARFRPIVLTAGTTIGGLIPLGLFGGPLWEGLAWAMVAGLALSTILTLYVVPTIYYMSFRGEYRSRDAVPPAEPQPQQA